MKINSVCYAQKHESLFFMCLWTFKKYIGENKSGMLNDFM